MATAEESAPDPGPDAGVDELKADIERTREQLGDTVAALSDKLDVKSRVERKASDTARAVAQRARRLRENPGRLALIAGTLAGGVLVWVRRR